MFYVHLLAHFCRSGLFNGISRVTVAGDNRRVFIEDDFKGLFVDFNDFVAKTVKTFVLYAGTGTFLRFRPFHSLSNGISDVLVAVHNTRVLI